MLTVSRVRKNEEISPIAESIIFLQEGEYTTFPALKKQPANMERGIENMLNVIQINLFLLVSVAAFSS